jgi:hypothetical protein
MAIANAITRLRTPSPRRNTSATTWGVSTGSAVDAAADGELSAEGILAALPTDFRLARMERFDGVQNTCAELRCMGADQCTSLLSWYLFLPACLQANVPR